jgi:hypothetical protein
MLWQSIMEYYTYYKAVAEYDVSTAMYRYMARVAIHRKQRQKDPLRVLFSHTQQGHEFLLLELRLRLPPHRRKHDDDEDDDAGD